MDIEGQPEILEGLFKGISEVFLFDYFWSGVFILIAGSFGQDGNMAFLQSLATGISWIIAYSLGADIKLLNHGPL